MQNFTYQNPVRIHFGKGEISKLQDEISSKQRVLLTYGGGSIKKNGVYKQVMDALAGREVYEFSGIEPNPHFETLMQAVKIAQEKKIDFLLAVGGGSVVDGTKFIAAAIDFNGDPWDILTKPAPLKSAVPLGCVLTLPATGSEMNGGAVITKASTKDKLFFIDPLVFPKFAILDPETTFSLSPRQTANGITDAFVHVLEQYLTYPAAASIQDRFSEGILLTLIEEGEKVLKHPNDYEVRANIMWAATMALNGLIGAGVPQDWTTHMLGHEITALFGLDHGQTLAIVIPAVMKFQAHKKREKILQYAERVLNIHEQNPEKAIAKAIAKTREFFTMLGVKTYLNEYGINADAIPKIIVQLEKHGMTALGEHGNIDLIASAEILRLALNA
ncbi:MAG: iron-containing alcohol dehydrogenase [Gammaproteobacteria bacterium]|nr:iron-containing alcohol dehydrogenase [Gammaproteobacteria bacterium]